MESQKVQFVGASCGKHGPYTFYKAFKYFRDNKFRILSLGEFFFLKILKEGPICIGELQLIWENSQEHQLLASVRLYYLPEHTPAGRENFHGEDEILAFSEKLILRLDDLVGLLYTEHVQWDSGLSLLHEDNVEGDTDEADIQHKFFANTLNSGLIMDDVQKEIEILGQDKEKLSSTCVKVLSFAQYCRYRAIMKRLENIADKWLKKQIIYALGGITSKSHDNRIMFCRDTFDDPDLDDLEVRMDHLAPNLKGRPRKKKTSTKSDGNGDSDSNETSSDVSTPSSRVKTSKRESALRNGFAFDKDRISKDEQAFLIDLHKFMKKRHTPIDRIPSLGFKQIDLWYFYSYAQKLGGYEQITRKRLWKHLYDRLGGNPGSTSAATCTRRHYEKLLLPYEKYDRGERENKPLPTKNKRKSSLVDKPKADVKKRLQEADDSDYDYEEEQRRALKKKRRCTLSLTQDKVKLWEEIRKHKAFQRDKLKKVSRNPKTVKSLLNHAEKEKNNLEMKTEKVENSRNNHTGSFDLDTMKLESVKQENGKIQLDGSVVKLEKLNGNSATAGDTKLTNESGRSIISQSRLFRPDPVQSSVNARGGDAKLLQHLDRAGLPHMPGHPVLPGGGLFYPPFIHMGAVHPLGLPVMHQLPVAMPTFIQPPVQQAKSSSSSSSGEKSPYRPNILRTPTSHSSSSSQQSLSSEHRPSVIHHGHQSKTSSATSKEASSTPPLSHNPNSHTSSAFGSASAPRAHSGASSSMKRLYNSPVPSEAHIPHSQRTHSSNTSRSLLFDFEAPKRPKMDTLPAHSGSSKPGASSDTEQPCDLSMKTLRQHEQKEDKVKERNGETWTNPATHRDESPFSVKSLAQSSVPTSRYTSPGLSSRSHLLLDRVHSPDIHTSMFSKSPVVGSSAQPVNNSKGSDSHRPLVPPPAHSNKVSDINSTSKKSTPVPASMHSPTDSSGLVHPAFPNHMVRPQFPQQPYFPSPMQLHQFFEAQIRANAVHAAAYEERMKQDQRGAYTSMPLPIFMPPVPLHAQATKDKSHYAHAK